MMGTIQRRRPKAGKGHGVTTREAPAITPEIATKILDHLREQGRQKGPKYQRRYLYMSLLANTGFRRSEGLGLFPEDFRELPSGEWAVDVRRQRTGAPKRDFDGTYSTALKTARSYGYAIIPAELGREVKEYVELMRIPDGHPIFPVTRRVADNWFATARKVLGLDPRLHPHSFCSYYIRVMGPRILKRLSEMKADPWDIEDFFRRSWGDIRKHYHQKRKPEEFVGLTEG